jgi:hypothetical protein
MATNDHDTFAVRYDHIGGYHVRSVTRGLDARCLMAKANIAHFLGDESCLVTAWESELLAFVDGAVSEDGDDVPSMFADEPVLIDAWFNGRKERSNTEGFAHEGRWYWYCYRQ